MAKTVTVTQVTNPVRAGERAFFSCVVANTDAAPVTLESLTVSEVTRAGVVVSQPNFLVPNAGPTSFPTLAATTGTATYGFALMFPSPATPGPSPANEPGGADPRQPAFPVYPYTQMWIEGRTSDGTVFSQGFGVAVLSAMAPFPPPEDGAAQFGQGGCSNIIAVLM